MNSVTFGRARFALLPVLAGAAMALAGNSFTSTQAFAADVVCTPNLSGTVLTTNTTCSGAGDQAVFLSQTATATLTLDGVTIPGPAALLGASAGVVNGTQNVTINVINGGSITATINDFTALGSQGTTGSSTVSVGATPLAATGSGDTAGLGVQTTTGAISITAAGTVIDGVALNAGSTGVGIGAESTTGAIGITTTGAGSIGNFAGTTLDFGIDAFATGGAVTINNTSQIGSTSATAGSGVDQSGIRAATSGSGTIAVTNSGAIVVDNATGSGNINNSGILASGGTGAVSITNSGAVTGGDFGLNGAGAGNVTVTNTGAVTGDTGIRANSTGTGKVTVTTSGAGTVTSGGGLTGRGISITSGTGGYALNVGANVTNTGGSAIQTTGTTGGNLIAINGGTVAGLGAGTTSATINMASSSGAFTTLTTAAGSTITSTSATAALQNSDLVLRGTGGKVIVNNAGTIRGRVDFSGQTGAANIVVFNNTGTWSTSGTSTFSGGVDTFNNSGTVITNGTTSLNFGPAGETFNNNAGGVINGAGTAGATNTTLNASFINNAGTISLVDGETNDVLTSPGFYTASGAAQISVDAALGGTGQTTCAAVVADCVHFTHFDGATNLVVNDTNTGAGGLNFDGIVVANSTFPGGTFTLTGSNVSNTLQGPAIQKGFVQYQLLPANDGTGDILLVGLPTGSMIELGSLPAGLQNIWNDSSEGTADRLAAVRQNIAAAANGEAPVPAQAGNGFGVWGKVSYSDMTRNTFQSNSIFGTGLGYDTSYTQGTLGIQVGVDKVISSGGGSALLAGVLAGYNNSVMRFDADRTKATYRVFNVGGYLSYMNNGGLSADLLIKDDIARVDLNVPGVSGLKDVDGNSFGVKGTLAQRIGMGTGGVYFQPQGTFAYVRSTLKNISDPSATFDFADANSARGTIGVNVGADTQGVGGYTYRPLVFLGVGHEFEGKNRVDITSGTTSISFKDKPMKTYGLASIGLNIFNQDGMTGFVKGDRLFSNDANAWQIQAGLRILR